MEPLASTLPETVLFNVTGDVNNIVYRYICPSIDNTIVPADSTTTLADGTTASTTVLNYGQGTILKLYNLSVCYI
jgi:hypothetical protein